MLARPQVTIPLGFTQGGSDHCRDWRDARLPLPSLEERIGGGQLRNTLNNLTELAWLGPECLGVFVGSPSVINLGGGHLVASHDYFGATSFNRTVRLLHSVDGGSNWLPLGTAAGQYWANLFARPGDAALYLLGNSGDDRSKVRDVVLSRSTDGGATWSAGHTLFKGWYATAPTPTVLAADGRLYRAMEGPDSKYKALLLWADADADDLTLASAWHASNAVSCERSFYPRAWRNLSTPLVWQEGNAVEAPDGTIALLLRVNGQTAAVRNVAGLLRFDRATSELAFDRFVSGPFSESKFAVKRDPAAAGGAAVYYAVSNNVTDQNAKAGLVWARNNQVLSTSRDLISWHVCARLLADDTGFHTLEASANYTGFHYADFAFDGRSLVQVVRSGYRGANSYHNANHAFAQRVDDYRRACGTEHLYPPVAFV